MHRGNGLSRPEELAREERRRLKEARIKKRQRKARRRVNIYNSQYILAAMYCSNIFYLITEQTR